MSDAKLFRLVHPQARANAVEAVRHARDGYMVKVFPPKRTLEQNDHIHAICSALEKSGLHWAGRERTKTEWKVLLVSGHAVATNTDTEVVEGLEGELVNLRESTAEMDKRRGSSLIEYSIAFCVNIGIDREALA